MKKTMGKKPAPKKSKAKPLADLPSDFPNIKSLSIQVKGKQGRMHALYAVDDGGEELFLGSFMRQDTLTYVTAAVAAHYDLPITRD